MKLSCGTDAGSSCSHLFSADDVWSIYIHAPVCVRSELRYVVLQPLFMLFINIPADINTQHIQDVTMETKHILHGPAVNCKFAPVYFSV